MIEERITHFEVAVHLGDHIFRGGSSVPDLTHQRLTALWDERLQRFVSKQGVLWLYFSALTEEQLEEALKKPTSSNPVMGEDVNRVQTGVRGYGRRFLTIGRTDYHLIDVAQLLRTNDISYDPKSSVCAWGEYYDWCADSIGKLVVMQLGLDMANYYLVPQLSRSKKDIEPVVATCQAISEGSLKKFYKGTFNLSAR
ncbi:hypothetical protein HY383_02460 [Candidatus Daviesbacteria bacterium]|nr:hypothetical protein [Candidatus Daviesbacteria bacterium]